MALRISPSIAVRLGAVVLLLVLGILGLATDLFRSPRSVVRSALANASSPADTELRFLVDVQADPEQPEKFSRLHFRAGPGPFFRTTGASPAVHVPFQFILSRRGVTLTFKGSAILRDGAGYVRIAEMPSYGDLGRTLEGRWLKIGESKSSPSSGSPDSGDQTVSLFAFFEGAIQDTLRTGAEKILGISVRKYELVTDDEQLRGAVNALPASGLKTFLNGRLEQFRVDKAALWIQPRSHRLVRARLELVPRAEESEIRRMIADATLVPLRGAAAPDVPEGAVRLRPETIQKILSQ